MLKVADNSGAKQLQVIRVLGGSHRRYAELGDIIVAAVKIAEPRKMVKKKDVVRAVIVRQKKEIRRRDGTRVKFEDNAAAVLKDEFGNPKGTMIKGPVAKEVAERWPAVAKIATIIV